MQPRNITDKGIGFDAIHRPSASWNSQTEFKENSMQTPLYALLFLFPACSGEDELYEEGNYHTIEKENLKGCSVMYILISSYIWLVHNYEASNCHSG